MAHLVNENGFLAWKKVFASFCVAVILGLIGWLVFRSRPEPRMEIEGFTALRAAMAQTQLREGGICNPRVLEAMAKVPRHQFAPPLLRPDAYEDEALPIGHGQTISQPYIVAFMTEKLEPKSADRVLEIGTGSGYQAAVLAELVQEVFSVEIIKELAEEAGRTLNHLGYQNVRIKYGDGYLGWPEHAPFDSVIVTCAPDHVPQPLIAQLKEGGRMIIPVGEGYDQRLFLLEKKGGIVRQTAVLPVRFVPMTGENVKGND